MRTIWKFPLLIVDDFIHLEMPVGSRVLHVDMQGDTPCIWAELDSDAPKEVREFLVFGTGHPIPVSLNHVGSFQMPPFVWHIYE